MKNQSLTHLDRRGAMHRVDVTGKPATHRVAIAEARVCLDTAAVEALTSAAAKKGDALAAARLAGIQAAKRTSELIPLCHTIPLSSVSVELEITDPGVVITTRAETVAQTGVEMEALTAASVAALTLYDMLKSVERGITIDTVRLLQKAGGQSDDWQRGT